MNISNQIVNAFSVYRSPENGNVFINCSYKLLTDTYENVTVILTEKTLVNSKPLAQNVKALETMLSDRQDPESKKHKKPIAISVNGSIGRPKIDGDNFSVTVFGYSVNAVYFDN